MAAHASADVTVQIVLEQLSASVVLPCGTPISPAGALLNALGEADTFPQEMDSAIVDASGEVTMEVAIGGGEYLELSELLKQLDDNPTLSIIANEEGVVDVILTIKKAAPMKVKLQVASHSGESLGEVDLWEDASGGDLLEVLCGLFCSDEVMTAAIVEQPSRKEGAWIAIEEPFGFESLLSKAKKSGAAKLVFVRPLQPVASVSQLRVRLPPGGTFKPVATFTTQGGETSGKPGGGGGPTLPSAGQSNVGGTDKKQARKEKKANATVDEDAAKAKKAACLQGDRAKRLMLGADGMLCITFLGGGKYKCNICDDVSRLQPTAVPPALRSLGEGCSGLGTHLISAKGAFGHGHGHIALHAKSHGKELSEHEIASIIADGSSKSYNGKRAEGSGRESFKKIARIAKLSASGVVQPPTPLAPNTPQQPVAQAVAPATTAATATESPGVAAPSGATELGTPVPFGAQMADAINGI
jgi:hypothetical protein